MSGLVNESKKIEEKLHDFKNICATSFDSTQSELEYLKVTLDEAPNLSDDVRNTINDCVTNLKTKMSDVVKAHRDVHPSISKFGKFIDKNWSDDNANITAYFVDRHLIDRVASCLPTKATVQSPFLKDGQSVRSHDELMQLIIIEHLLRQGLESLAMHLVKAFNLNPTDICLDKFRELSNLISTILRGDLSGAQKWLSENKEHLGSKASELQYSLVKLDFLAAMQQRSKDLSAILHAARQLVPFAQTHSSDFERLMGSLVFLGRGLEETPYADLSFSPLVSESMEISEVEPQDCPDESERIDRTKCDDGSYGQPVPALGKSCQPNSALDQAAGLFRVHCCQQLHLSDVDPLLAVFNSGCRLLNRQQHLQRAIACLSKYTSADGDSLPVAVELDPIAHRHNIFHCPVIKEVTTTSNGPVRLSCGHAISRDAFESLPSGDRSKVKCPYCPVETYKNQGLDLIF